MLPWSEYLGDVAPGEGIYGPWPASGEIDVMETTNDMDFVNGSIHFGGPLEEGLHQMIVSSTPLDPPATEYHVFGVEWHFGLIRLYVDGVYYGHATSQYGPQHV
jgi:beta-glucanase (GH16 family)